MPGWDDLLVKIDGILPDPARELGLDPNLPQNQDVINALRIHMDAVLPRYRADLAAEWFNLSDLEGFPKDYMHPFDRTNPPEGEGWVVQIIGHHYNPSPIGKQAEKLPSEIRRQYAFGPVNYLTQKVIPRLWTADMRQFGIHHATLTWLEIDDKWVTSKVANGNPLPATPILPRPTPGQGRERRGHDGRPGEDVDDGRRHDGPRGDRPRA